MCQHGTLILKKRGCQSAVPSEWLKLLRQWNKFLFYARSWRDKFLGCDSITICSGSYSKKVSREPIARARERYLSSERRRDLICARTDRDSRCSQQKSCTSNRSFTSCFGFCAVIPMFAISMSTVWRSGTSGLTKPAIWVAFMVRNGATGGAKTTSGSIKLTIWLRKSNQIPKAAGW